uniref:Uncharacterized protein n=1 Tax=Knipowitschia caucasica TaxID=637954 RepID=A0AAV2JHS3_KNICA
MVAAAEYYQSQQRRRFWGLGGETEAYQCQDQCRGDAGKKHLVIGRMVVDADHIRRAKNRDSVRLSFLRVLRFPPCAAVSSVCSGFLRVLRFPPCAPVSFVFSGFLRVP